MHVALQNVRFKLIFIGGRLKMGTVQLIIGILLIVMGVFLIISVLMQSSKDHRLSGSIAGGAETFFGKTKGRTLDALFNKLTTVITIIFVLLVLVLFIIQPSVETLNQRQADALAAETSGEETEQVVDEDEATADEADNEAQAVVDDAEAAVEEEAETTDEATVEEAETTDEATVEEEAEITDEATVEEEAETAGETTEEEAE